MHEKSSALAFMFHGDIVRSFVSDASKYQITTSKYQITTTIQWDSAKGKKVWRGYNIKIHFSVQSFEVAIMHIIISFEEHHSQDPLYGCVEERLVILEMTRSPYVLIGS